MTQPVAPAIEAKVQAFITATANKLKKGGGDPKDVAQVNQAYFDAVAQPDAAHVAARLSENEQILATISVAHSSTGGIGTPCKECGKTSPCPTFKWATYQHDPDIDKWA